MYSFAFLWMMVTIMVLSFSIIVEAEQVNPGDTCTFGNQSFQRGEDLGEAFLTRCGSATDYPCFCNPDLPQGAQCPYCGFAAGDGTLYCARNEQTITFPDGSITRICSCTIPTDPAQDPIRDCSIEGVPSTSPGASPSTPAVVGEPTAESPSSPISAMTPTAASPTMTSPTMTSPTVASPTMASPTVASPTMASPTAASPTAASPTMASSTVASPAAAPAIDSPAAASNGTDTGGGSGSSGICEFPNADGEIVTIKDGETFGDLIEGVCGAASDWPSYCYVPDANADFQIEYPYCVFTDTSSGEVLCAANNASITYENADGDEVTCFCTYTRALGPEPDCQGGGTSSTAAPGQPSTSDGSASAGQPTKAPVAAPTKIGLPSGGEKKQSSALKRRHIKGVGTIASLILGLNAL